MVFLNFQAICQERGICSNFCCNDKLELGYVLLCSICWSLILFDLIRFNTLPETNIAPENGWLEDDPTSFWEGFREQVLLLLVSRRVDSIPIWCICIVSMHCRLRHRDFDPPLGVFRWCWSPPRENFSMKASGCIGTEWNGREGPKVCKQYLEPFHGAPCFDWNFGLLLGGWFLQK